MIAYFVREIRPAANLNFDTKMAQLVLDLWGIFRFPLINIHADQDF
jgi:hypothetical protein